MMIYIKEFEVLSGTDYIFGIKVKTAFFWSMPRVGSVLSYDLDNYKNLKYRFNLSNGKKAELNFQIYNDKISLVFIYVIHNLSWEDYNIYSNWRMTQIYEQKPSQTEVEVADSND